MQYRKPKFSRESAAAFLLLTGIFCLFVETDSFFFVFESLLAFGRFMIVLRGGWCLLDAVTYVHVFA